MELFVSDLDGTLLNKNKEISDYSKKELNRLIEQGVNFTIASARTPATVVDILEGINIKIPVVLMNGVLIYDIAKQEYIKINKLEDTVVKGVLDILKKYDKNCFLYGIKDNHIFVYYRGIINNPEKDFYNERCEKKLKTFVKIDDYYSLLEEMEVINFVLFDDYEKIKAIYNELKLIEGLYVDYYKDIYGEGYYLDAYSSKASKANGIKELERYVNCDKLISFGDNVNDIPMFKISDECYAVENGAEELKRIATKVIESNEKDGVVKFISKYSS
ncbi:HAD family hydrolase [Clostridium isatidis]|uniref:Hydrolase n=1 Tax=Clostridium isatidis TaxID=182773 RepID=A0A343JE82_9CLOT|nr:HAD family hydrolase [Clostridium isatidis]ASW43840.1 hydrolase [Clostridium isatidis]